MAPGRTRLRNRIELAAYVVLRSLFRALPLRLADGFGSGVALFYRLVDRRRRRLVARNLALAFPGMPPREVDRLGRQVYRHLGSLAADLSALRPSRWRSFSPGSRSSASSTPARPRPPGAGLLHAPSRELGVGRARHGALGFPVTIVARPLDPLLDARLTAMREKTGCRIVSRRTPPERS
ncbi:MAG: hypothetical protein IPN83_00025 [Holophagales bacterium]|nr:hypothetical protein [Holophagales bacterium]